MRNLPRFHVGRIGDRQHVIWPTRRSDWLDYREASGQTCTITGAASAAAGRAVVSLQLAISPAPGSSTSTKTSSYGLTQIVQLRAHPAQRHQNLQYEFYPAAFHLIGGASAATIPLGA